jgi:tRNA nucleotidyltransferase (CCA-adding enzyme)
VGTAWHRFREDYLRILRALRFAARFGFEIEQATWKAAKARVAGLQHLSAERVREEWMRGIEGARVVSEFVRLWEKVGALKVWLPEALPGNGERGTGKVQGVDRLPARDPVLITIHLSHNPGATLTRLKCSRSDIERARRVGMHRGDLPDPESAVSVRRWMSAVGDAVDDLVALAEAEGAELRGAVDDVRRSGAPLAVGDLVISGNDLIELGVPKGPAVGEILRSLLDEVLDNPNLNTRTEMLQRAKDKATVPRSPFPVPPTDTPKSSP